VKSLGLALSLCLAVVTSASAQTTPPPDAPKPQPPERHKNIFESFAPPLSLANDARPMTPGDKFKLFAVNTVNPFTFLSTAGWAGIEQAQDTYPSWGQGAEGFGKRFGAVYASTATSNFFSNFMFPSILRQDPRYFRKLHGSFGSRLGYALSRVVVTRTDHGRSSPNVSLWLGAGSSAALGNLYYPDDQQDAGHVMGRFGINIATTAGFNVAREFWPDISRKLFHHNTE
jgi:hypothetical protein